MWVLLGGWPAGSNVFGIHLLLVCFGCFRVFELILELPGTPMHCSSSQTLRGLGSGLLRSALGSLL